MAASRSGIQAGAARCFGTRNGAVSSSSICWRVRTSGSFFSGFRQLQLAHRIAPEIFSFDEKAIEGAKGGKLQANVGARLALLHQLEEIIAEIIRAAASARSGHFSGRGNAVERLTIGDQRARRDVSLDFEIAQEFLRERIPGGACGHGGLLGLFNRGALERGARAAAHTGS